MGTTIFYGLLAWVVGVICPQSGLDIPAVTSPSAAGEPGDFSTIATAHKQCQTPGVSFRNRRKKIRNQRAHCCRRTTARQGRWAQGAVTRARKRRSKKSEVRSDSG